MQAMFEAVVSGTAAEGIEGVEVEIRPALTAAVPDVLAADGYVLGTPANIGFHVRRAQALLRHYLLPDCLEATVRRPYALYVHGNQDTTGAVRVVESIASGLQWRRARPPVRVLGRSRTRADLEAWLGAFGATMAAELTGGRRLRIAKLARRG